MNAVSVDRQRNWKAIGPERQTGLEIVLLKRTYVFPWSQFLYAEGGDDERFRYRESARRWSSIFWKATRTDL